MEIANLLNSRAKVLKIIFIILMILTVIFLVINYVLRSEIRISTSSASNDKSVVLYVTGLSGNQVAKKEVPPGKTVSLRLPVGNFNVSASQGETETIGQAKLVRFKSSKLSLKLVPQKAVSKLGSESLGCDMFANKILFSHSCTKQGVILRHDNQPNQFVNPVPILDNRVFPVVYSYRNGLLSKFNEAETNSTYFNFVDLVNNSLTYIKTPRPLATDSTSLITDKANKLTNQRFLLIDKNDKIYSYLNTDDGQPKELKLPDEPGLKESSSLLAKGYSLFNDQLYVYVGKGEESGEDKGEVVAQQKLKNGFLFSIDLSQPNPKFNSFKLPTEFNNNDIHIIDTSHVAVLTKSGLFIYSLEVGGLSLAAFFPGASYVTVGSNGSLWFTKNNAIYEYVKDTNQASKIFESKHLRPSRLTSLGDSFMFNAFIQNDSSSTLHSYLVTNRSAEAQRLEEKLPYTKDSGLPILKMDYSGNQLKVQLALTSLGSDKQTGQLFYDQAEFNSAKQKVLDQLRSDGFDLSKLQIFFTI